MANPLASFGVSPLMNQLIKRHVGGGFPNLTPKLHEEDLTPAVPNVRVPNLRPHRFVSEHLRTVLQPKKML